MLELVEALLAHEASQHLRDRAAAGCRQFIRNAAADGDLPVTFGDEVEFVFVRCALVFDSGLVSYPYIETRLDIHRMVHGQAAEKQALALGHYRLITALDGSFVDDFLVIDPEVNETEVDGAGD